MLNLYKALVCILRNTYTHTHRFTDKHRQAQIHRDTYTQMLSHTLSTSVADSLSLSKDIVSTDMNDIMFKNLGYWEH